LTILMYLIQKLKDNNFSYIKIIILRNKFNIIIVLKNGFTKLLQNRCDIGSIILLLYLYYWVFLKTIIVDRSIH